jgi:hypothetical protein
VCPRSLSTPSPHQEVEPQSLGALEQVVRRLIKEELVEALEEVIPKLLASPPSYAVPAPADENSGGFITLQEAARRAKRSVRTLWRWRTSGLKTHGPRRNLVDPRELDAFVRSQGIREPLRPSHDEQASEILARRRRRKAG